jgi:predicted transcriptional regulator YdeE
MPPKRKASSKKRKPVKRAKTSKKTTKSKRKPRDSVLIREGGYHASNLVHEIGTTQNPTSKQLERFAAIIQSDEQKWAKFQQSGPHKHTTATDLAIWKDSIDEARDVLADLAAGRIPMID